MREGQSIYIKMANIIVGLTNAHPVKNLTGDFVPIFIINYSQHTAAGLYYWIYWLLWVIIGFIDYMSK